MSDQPQPETLTGPDLADALSADSVSDGAPLLGHVGDEPVILVRRATEIFGIGATCSHNGGPLAAGLVMDDTVRCPWHHACFSLRIGEALRAPALNPVTCYEVVERKGRVVVIGKRAKLWHRLLRRPASECGILCRGDGAHGRGARAAGGW